jgi:hypothetical protein
MIMPKPRNNILQTIDLICWLPVLHNPLQAVVLETATPPTLQHGYVRLCSFCNILLLEVGVWSAQRGHGE